MKFDRDLLANADSRQAARAAMSIVTAIQDFRPHEQVGGLAAAFMLMAEHFDIRVPDACELTGNIMNTVEGKRPEFKAVEAYIQGELK